MREEGTSLCGCLPNHTPGKPQKHMTQTLAGTLPVFPEAIKSTEEDSEAALEWGAQKV